MRQPTTEKQKHWAAILERAEQSGETLADFARSNNLAAQTLYQWRSVLKEKEPSTTQAGIQAFRKVVTPATLSAVSIDLDHVRLNFNQLPDVHWLSELIRSQSNES